jgi:hypothetical protein
MTTLHTVHRFCGGSSRKGVWYTPKFRRVKMDLMVALLNKTDIVSLIVKMEKLKIVWIFVFTTTINAPTHPPYHAHSNPYST